MSSRSIRSRLLFLARRSAEVWARPHPYIPNIPNTSNTSSTSSTSQRQASVRTILPVRRDLLLSSRYVRGGALPENLPFGAPPDSDDKDVRATRTSHTSPPSHPNTPKPPPSPPGKHPRLPRILYIPNPIIWLTNKIDFSLLRYEWDPKFSECEFRRGATQAVCTITQLVADKQIRELHGLLTRRALAQLEHELETQWGDLQRKYIAVHPSNIQIALPRRVHFRTAAHNDTSVASEKKLCDIDMIFIALKWIEAGAARAIVFIEIMARFHREYTQGVIPEWTVTAFKVSRFNVMPK